MKLEEFEALKKEIKTTIFARYSSSRRLSLLNKLSLFALTTASISLIVTALTSKYLSCSVVSSDLVELLQVIGSIIILTLSIAITFADFSLKSERMRNSADRLNTIYKKLRIITFSSEKIPEISKLYSDYDNAVAGDNHSNWDYRKGRLERKKQEENVLQENEKIKITSVIWNCKVEISLFSMIILFLSTSILVISLCLC